MLAAHGVAFEYLRSGRYDAVEFGHRIRMMIFQGYLGECHHMQADPGRVEDGHG